MKKAAAGLRSAAASYAILPRNTAVDEIVSAGG
jgi:hypothetical protein